MSEERDYTYRRTWKREALSASLMLCFCNLFGLVFSWFFWQEGTFARFVIVAVVGGNNLLFGHHLLSTLNRKQDFVCALGSGRLTCDCPSQSGGRTFSVPISDIQRIEVNDDNGTATLRMIDGAEHWLTSNYGNPSRYLINSMMAQNPNIELVHV